jgi:hypothetical protein
MRRTAIAALAGSMLICAGAGSALAVPSTAEITVSGGSLSVTAANFQSVGATLTGSDQTITTTPATPWVAVDPRGTGAAWTVTASATNLVSTLSGNPDRIIPSSRLTLTTGTVTAGAGSDAATGITGSTAAAFTNPTGGGQTDVTVLSAPGPHKGSFSITPTLGITIPAAAEASYTGSGSTPYRATVTVTIS